MDNEKFNSTIEYFADNGIDLPTDVRNSIEDVFEENDSISEVLCYHKEDLADFEQDLTLRNEIHCFLNGSSNGFYSKTFTYYGDVTWSLSEVYDLDPGHDEPVETLLESTTDDLSVIDPKQYQVVMVETVTWDTENNEYSKKDVLHIYCPESGEDIKSDDERYDDIYRKLKEDAAHGE